MIKQQFYTVWKENEEWFDFPQANEQNITDMLMQKGLMQACVILPKGEVPHKVKVVTANSNNAVNEKLMKEIEDLKKQLAQQQEPKKTVTPTKTK
jgi:hypothetical protein